MKKTAFRLGLSIILAALVLAACAPAATPAVIPPTPAPVKETVVVPGPTVVQQVIVTAPPEPTKPTPKFRVAVVFPSTITDLAFSQSMYQGLLAVQEKMGGKDKMEIAYSENMFNVPDAAAAIRDYASQGYNLVIAHGSQYGTSLSQIAPDFPDVSFAWGTSLDTFQAQGISNVFAYQAEAQQGGYVLGTLATLMSKTKKLGVTGPVEAGDAKLYVDGFKAGAAATDKNVKVSVTYTGSFSDQSLMAAAADTHIKNGADALTGSSQSVLGSIGVAKDKKAYWFGAQWDQSSFAPDTVVASMVYDWSSVISDMIASHQAGVMGGKAYTLTFKNNGLKIAYNDKIQVPADAKAAADAAIKGIEDGTINPLGAKK